MPKLLCVPERGQYTQTRIENSLRINCQVNDVAVLKKQIFLFFYDGFWRIEVFNHQCMRDSFDRRKRLSTTRKFEACKIFSLKNQLEKPKI